MTGTQKLCRISCSFCYNHITMLPTVFALCTAIFGKFSNKYFSSLAPLITSIHLPKNPAYNLDRGPASCPPSSNRSSPSPKRVGVRRVGPRIGRAGRRCAGHSPPRAPFLGSAPPRSRDPIQCPCQDNST